MVKVNCTDTPPEVHLLRPSSDESYPKKMDALTNSINAAMSKCSARVDDLIQDCENKGYNDEDAPEIHRSRSLLSKVQSALAVPADTGDVMSAASIEREGKDALLAIHRDVTGKLNSFKDQKR